jgi:hypothetical protein
MTNEIQLLQALVEINITYDGIYQFFEGLSVLADYFEEIKDARALAVRQMVKEATECVFNGGCPDCKVRRKDMIELRLSKETLIPRWEQFCPKCWKQPYEEPSDYYTKRLQRLVAMQELFKIILNGNHESTE